MYLPLTCLFTAVWLLDFEFQQLDGALPHPICMVARELNSGRVVRLFEDDLDELRNNCPLFTNEHTLFVAFYSSAEWSCFLELGWPLPVRVLDLYPEFKRQISGLAAIQSFSLLNALIYHGLDAVEAAEKDEMRKLAMRGGPFTHEEEKDLLEYCESDVDSLVKLLVAMLPKIDLPRALLRGRYMTAAARIERNGVPIDTVTFNGLTKFWPEIQDGLVGKLDNHKIWEGRTFKSSNFARYLEEQGISWPYLDSGKLALDDDTFRAMAKLHPEICSVRELRYTLGQMRLIGLAVGPDGRNRCMLSAFGSKTSRNQPSNVRYIFGPATWVRGLIKPPVGRAFAYIDWEQQEFGIAAALSDDKAMMDAYSSGDPYLAFAKQAGAVPPDATKSSHPEVRERFKVCALAVLYGMGEKSLAESLGVTLSEARELLRMHRQTYKQFWAWSESVVNFAMLNSFLETVFGWRVNVGAESNPRSLANFQMQANGAEMLRLALCMATEMGIIVCAPVHDAVGIEADANKIDAEVLRMRSFMATASRIVLNGFELRTEVKIVSHPDRYMDKRGTEMWSAVTELLHEQVSAKKNKAGETAWLK